MKNSPNTTKLQRTNILYKYECNVGDCEPQAYIGYTRTTLSRRITMHLQSGAPLKHSQDFHSSTLNREQMVSNTSIIRQENDFNRLEIMEALYIKYTKPEINLQTTGMGRTLRLLGDKELCHTTNSRMRSQTTYAADARYLCPWAGFCSTGDKTFTLPFFPPISQAVEDFCTKKK